MGIIQHKPTTPTRRYANAYDFKEITRSRPHKPLTEMKRKKGGRNQHGHITAKHRGGGHKQRMRLVDFLRQDHESKARVLSIEYDPLRTARLALIEYEKGKKSYILSPNGLKVGDSVVSGENVDIKTGNHTPLKNIPAGTPIHNIELLAGQGAKLVRSAGGVAQILSKEDRFAHIKLPSGQVRMIPLEAYATVGQCSNLDRENLTYGKAGRRRWKGRTPRVRGVAMNPVDHPLGGGEGKASGGRHPVSPWGQASKGLKTRKKNKSTNKYIVKDRRK